MRLLLFLLLLLLLLLAPPHAVALECLEGSDCVADASCGGCSGVACTRIVSYSPDDNHHTALTCIPYDTRSYGRSLLQEEGCRSSGDRLVCVCYGSDYCNAASLSLARPLSLFILLLLRLQ